MRMFNVQCFRGEKGKRAGRGDADHLKNRRFFGSQTRHTASCEHAPTHHLSRSRRPQLADEDRSSGVDHGLRALRKSASWWGRGFGGRQPPQRARYTALGRLTASERKRNVRIPKAFRHSPLARRRGGEIGGGAGAGLAAGEMPSRPSRVPGNSFGARRRASRTPRALSHVPATPSHDGKGDQENTIPTPPTMFVTTAIAPATSLVSAQTRPMITPTTSTATIAASQYRIRRLVMT